LPGLEPAAFVAVAPNVTGLRRKEFVPEIGRYGTMVGNPEVVAKILVNGLIGCVVKGGGPQRESNPPGNWFAPPGSNQSSRGGNETAEASGAEGRKGDSVSMQAVTRVNAEQASKTLMQEPTRPDFGEGRS